MYTTNIDLLQNIFETLTFQKNKVELSHDLEIAINEKTGFYNCDFYDETLDDFSLIFEGEINITKCLNNELDINKETRCYGLKHEYFEGKINRLGQECLKSYSKDFEYKNNTYKLSIVEYFGQNRNDMKGKYDGFNLIAIQLPNELCHS